MKKFIRLWKGYVKIKIYGYAPERFLNLCKHNDIDLYSIRQDANGYILEITKNDFFLLKKLLRKTGTKMHILSKKGLPFVFFKYRKHKFFVISIAIAFVCLYIMSQVVWQIEVNGNYKITDIEFIQYLATKNIKKGMFISRVDCADLEEKIRADYPEIIWVSVQIQGTQLLINFQELIKENDTYIENLSEEMIGTDLVAEHKGMITSVVTRNGTPMVKAGDVVEEGTVLISGCKELYDDYGTIIGYEYCHADGDVIISTEFNYEKTFSRIVETPQRTGKNKYSIRIIGANKSLSIGFKNNTFENSYLFTQQKPFTIGTIFEFPFEILILKNEEIILNKSICSEEEMKVIAARDFALYSKKMAKKGFQIIDKDVKIKFNDEQALVSGTVQMEYLELHRKDTPIKSLEEKEGIEKNGFNSASNGNSS